MALAGKKSADPESLWPGRLHVVLWQAGPHQEILPQSVTANFACVASAGTEIKHAKLHIYTYDKDFTSLIFANTRDSAAYA